MEMPTPIVTRGGNVSADWIDENGHMNVAFYLKCFDDAFYDVFPVWALEFNAALQFGYSHFIAQANIQYLREMILGDTFCIETQLINHDRKRMQWFMQMKKPDGEVAATCEFLCLVVSMELRKVAPMPEEWFERLSALRRAHGTLPVPESVGRGVSTGVQR
jgi:acyl-CoA thioester hydrolase